jgi:hypothetical protein
MTASSTVLGGAAIQWLIHSDSRRKLRIIDLFTSQGDGLLVCDFIVSTTPYSTGTHPDTVTEMWTLRVLSFGNRKIRVFESFTTAMSALSRCNTTAFMGFVDGRSLRHAYPGLMDARIAITTPSQLPIESTLEDHQSIWRVLKRTRERGYKVETELPFTHSCGHHPDCPATLRTSCDSGWLNISLPAVHYGSSGDRPGTCWSLFGTGCKRGILDGGDTISVVAHEGVFQSHFLAMYS